MKLLLYAIDDNIEIDATTDIATLALDVLSAAELQAKYDELTIRVPPSSAATRNTLRTLVAFQFCISTALIIGTLVFYQQLHYIRNKSLGYSPEQTVALKIAGAETRQQADALEAEVKQLAFVRGMARSQTFPGRSGSGRFIGHGTAIP